MATAAEDKRLGLSEEVAQKRTVVLEFLKQQAKAPKKPALDAVSRPPAPKKASRQDIKIDFLSAAPPALVPAKPNLHPGQAVALAKRPRRRGISPQAVAAILAILLASYLLFCLYLYSFKPQSPWVMALARRVPVPVLISSYGAVDYYQYFELRRRLQGAGASSAELDDRAASAAVEWQIVAQLAREYDLNRHLSTSGLLLEVGKAVITDPKLNGSAFSKASRIKQLTAAGRSLEAAAAEQGATARVEYLEETAAVKRFGPGVLELKEGQQSSIIVLPDGFYLLEMKDRLEGAVELKYVQVGQRTLAQVVDERLASTKVINLVR